MKIYLILFAFLSFPFVISAQDAEVDSTATQSKTIVDSYKELIEESGNWQEYRLLKKTAVAAYETKLKQGKDAYESEISALKKEIASQTKETKELKEQLADTQNSLVELQEQKDSMQFFGNNLDKSLFQSIVFGIIGVLVLLLIIISIKFKSNSAATKEAVENLSETEKEFEEYKRNALEKQQILGRQLLDEKNKVNKLKTGGTK